MTTFVITWKEQKWAHSNILNLIKSIETDGYAIEPWRFMSHKMVKQGDLVVLLKQMPNPRGIFGIGTVHGPMELGDIGDDKQRPMFPIKFTKIVDPKETFLITKSELEGAWRSDTFNIQASGMPLNNQETEAVKGLFNDDIFSEPVRIPRNLSQAALWALQSKLVTKVEKPISNEKPDLILMLVYSNQWGPPHNQSILHTRSGRKVCLIYVMRGILKSLN